MTREQDFERRLAEWLGDGPATAPTEVVEEAIERTIDRRQRHPLWGWLRHQGGSSALGGRARGFALLGAVVLTLLTALAVAMPFGAGPRPAPEMDSSEALAVTGTAVVIDESASRGTVERLVRHETTDPRTSGEARKLLVAEGEPETGPLRTTGSMRLENEWGAWEGSVVGGRLQDGSQFEYGWLMGQGTYDGFSYFHSIRGHATETEQAVEGAIWPGEPPLMPDPSLLP